MRLILFTSFLLVYCASSAQSWAPIGTKWHFDQDDFYPNPDDFVDLEVFRDTLIENQVYQILEDTLASIKIYTYKSRDTVWVQSEGKKHILYDYNLQVGDTASTFLPFVRRSTNYVVDSMGLMPVNGHELRTWFITNLFDENSAGTLGSPIIENIGTCHFLFPQPGFVDPPYGGRLLNVYHPEIGNVKVESCQLQLVATQYLNSKNLNLYPNPSFGYINITGVLDPFQYQLFDVQGRLINSGNCTGDCKLYTGQYTGLITLRLWTKKGIFQALKLMVN